MKSEQHQQAGWHAEDNAYREKYDRELQKFNANAVYCAVLAERERCAKKAEQYDIEVPGSVIAEAIRSGK